MKTNSLILFGLLLPFLTTVTLGQSYGNRPGLPGSPASLQSSESSMLPSNYRLTFSGTSGEKPLGQLSVLTCSERVQVSGPLNAEDPKTVFEISGTLSEKEGSLVFTYSIGFSVLIQPPEAAAGERLGNARPGNANASYVNHSASGSLRIKPGEVYEVLKSGGNAYTVSISPETKP